MTQACLLLNASYEPLTMVPLHRAIRLVHEGRARVVEADARARVRSASLDLALPHVIMLEKWVKVPKRFRRTVTNTFLAAREGYRCAYCGRHQDELRGREFMNRDHILPQSRGGENSWANCVLACSTCNGRKADRTPSEAGMTLRVVPREPEWVHLAWAVRRLTPLQRKFVEMFYGPEALAAFRDRHLVS